jgi:hypothetical protein
MNQRGQYSILNHIKLHRGLFFGLMIIVALFAFEMFNFSTTEFALSDLLGNLKFSGFRWASILAVAFCGIDFAGIARLFTPEQDDEAPAETWYLFGAWLLAATMNAMLTWWGVSLAILNHQSSGNVIIAQTLLLRVVPIFVAVMVWLIRVLIIGTFSLAGARLFTQPETLSFTNQRISSPAKMQSNVSLPRQHRPASAPTFRPSPKPVPRVEPTYEYDQFSFEGTGARPIDQKPESRF